MPEMKAVLVDPDDDEMLAVVLLAELDNDAEVCGSGTWAALLLGSGVQDHEHVIVARDVMSRFAISTFKTAGDAKLAWAGVLHTFAELYEG